MEVLFNRYKRGLISLSLSIFIGISGVTCMEVDLEFTGFLLALLALSSLAYMPLFWLINRKKDKLSSPVWTRNEIRLMPVLIGVLCLVGLFESNPNQPGFTVIFTILLLYTILFGAVLLRNDYLRKKGAPLLSKSFITKLKLWSFIIGLGWILIMLDEYGDNETLIIIGLFYFPLLFILIARWVFKQMKSIISLKNEKAKTELLHLKSQVNPHFFFNMLNNLYGLVGTDAKKAQNLILKLSDMMRYSIYEGEKDSVSLEEEAEYLKNYIELHKMRYHKKIDVVFNLQIQEDGCKIMPLLFIILLENAFKHGVETLRENAYVHVNMITIDNEIQFDVENNFDPSQQDDQDGIGLKNLKRRLELVYPNSHDLSSSKVKDVYRSQLNIKRL
jgi:hypothetical protein